MSRRRGLGGVIIVVSGILICALWTVDIARAAIRIESGLIVEQEYSDNFYRAETNKAEVYVTRVSPGVKIEALTARSRLNLDYRLNYVAHHDTEANIDASRDDYVGHELSLLVLRKLFSRLEMGLTENYLLTREPGASDVFSQIVERNRYWRNRVSPTISYDIGDKGKLKLGYRKEVFRYTDQKTPVQDSSEDRGILALTYHFNQTNHLDLETQIWARDYNAGASDYRSYQARFIFRHEFSTYLKGEAGTGYHSRDFGNAGLKDLEEFVFHVGLEGATRLSKVNFSFARNINDFTQGDEYFVAYRANLYAERTFREAIRAYLGGYYQLSDYARSEREDNSTQVYGGVGYSFLHKLFELSLEYNYTNRDSNQAGRDYEESRVYLRLNIYYK